MSGQKDSRTSPGRRPPWRCSGCRCRRTAVDAQGRAAVFVDAGDIRAHHGQRVDDVFHGALLDGRVPGQGHVEVLAARMPGDQAHGGAAVAAVKQSGGALSVPACRFRAPAPGRPDCRMATPIRRKQAMVERQSAPWRKCGDSRSVPLARAPNMTARWEMDLSPGHGQLRRVSPRLLL